MDIINLTRFPASEEQKKNGVVEPTCKSLSSLKDPLSSLNQMSIEKRAEWIVHLATGYEKAMIECGTLLAKPLEIALIAAGIGVVYTHKIKQEN